MADLGLEQMVEELLTETKKQDTEEDFETHFLAPARFSDWDSLQLFPTN